MGSTVTRRVRTPPTTWVRVNRRTGMRGDVVLERGMERIVKQRAPGPWHAEYTARQTWCGRQPAKLLSAERREGAELPPGDKVCPDCTRAIADERPHPNRNRGQRGA